MIGRRELVAVGSVLKPHGVKGEMNALVDIPDLDLSELPCVFFELDGLMVPFFVGAQRRRGAESVLVTIDGVDSEPRAADFAGLTIYVRKQDLPEDDDDDEGDGFYLADLIGYRVTADGMDVGTVEDFDDSTANVLMTVRADSGRTVNIPVADEFFTSIDPESGMIEMTLPEGLLDL